MIIFETGSMFFNETTSRMDILFTNGKNYGTIYGGLHCGESFQVKIKNKWVDVRIELGNEWYLLGENNQKINIPTLIGLPVRVQESIY